MSAEIIAFARPTPRTAPPLIADETAFVPTKLKRNPEAWARWRAAERRTRALLAYFEIISRMCTYDDEIKSLVGPSALPGSFDRDHKWSVLARYRQAIADQLLTPAPTQEDLLWKKRQSLDFLPVRHEDVERAIAADEAYLAPYKTGPRRPKNNG